MPNLFEIAARKKFRFPSTIGQLTVEQLFDLPLSTTTNKPSLDSTARMVNADLKAAGEESFVATSSPASTELAQKLEIVKFVIASRQADAAAEAERRAKRDRKSKILDALDAAEGRELSSKSAAELRAELAALDD